jgi:iron complex outermembrane receptor protein
LELLSVIPTARQLLFVNRRKLNCHLMKNLIVKKYLVALAAATAAGSAPGQIETSPSTNPPPTALTRVVVTAKRFWIPEANFLQPSAQARSGAQDSAALLAETPGAAVIRNGPQTGIVQLRGLSGDRVKVSVDGMSITPACPNHMDPPLHYAAPSSVNALAVMAGVTPVSHGGDSIAGTVLVEPKPLRFATNDQTLWFGEAGAAFRSGNDGYGVNGVAGAASQRVSAAYEGSWQTADDLRFPGGRVADTGFETQQHGVRSGYRTETGLWSLDAGLTRTRDAGTPALPMDMIEDDSYRIGLRHTGSYAFGELEGRFYFHSIEHLMDNYSLRPLAAGTMPMRSPAESDDLGFNLGATLPRDLHTFRIGGGFHENQFDASQQNVTSGARQDTLNEATRTRIGTHLEWQGDWSGRWTTLVGVRNDTVLSDAADVALWFPASAADRAAFNARDHDFTDVNWDVTAAVRFTPNESSHYELAFARKNRAPSLLERYLWTPLSASAGQADGRTYLGNLDLDSETSHQFAATADWHGGRWQFKVTPFYNFVSDYIQGAPTSRIVNGQPVLQFQNVDRADLYGVDSAARVELSEQFALRGTLSHVRGINRDNNDNLYRIAPLHGTVALDHKWRAWQSTAEVVWADAQNEVAAYNGELTTPGYALLNLRTAYTFRERLTVAVGIENLFDEFYAGHLSGINRVLGSDVTVGERIPGAGRFVSVTVSCRF